jgi:sugar phosphate isomerase/epimerase
MLSRRRFLAASTAATAAGLVAARATAATAPGHAPRATTDRLGPIGVQLFSLPKLLEQDLDGALAMLAGLGYREVELFGPYPFCVPEALESWKALEPQLGFSGSGFFGRSARQMREALDRHGLSAPAAHIDLATLRQRLPQVGDAAAQLGLKYIGISNIPPEERRTLDDYKRMADDFNAMGHKAQPLGFKILYHNHGYGLHPMQGEIPFRVLMDRVDPTVVAAEMDLFWTVAGGADPVALLADYPRHYRLMHVKDMSKQGRFAGDGGDASQWFALFPLMTTAGNGVLELPRILGQARRSGVEHFFVEQDLVANPPEALGASIRFLRAMELAG